MLPAVVAVASASSLAPGTVVLVDGTAGTVVVDGDRRPCLVGPSTLQAFTFAGWNDPIEQPDIEVDVLTPRTSVIALHRGFRPTLHPSAGELHVAPT